MKQKTDIKWELGEAIILCRELNKISLQYGYVIALTGGVLFKGASANDLDLVMYPHNEPQGYDECVLALAQHLKAKLVNVVQRDKVTEPVVVVMFLADDQNREVDIFIPHVNQMTRQDNIKTYIKTDKELTY